ncbi:MAG: diacylglycerol kinase family lipid kinase [Acidobacteria bacterium]|nr:diacylglycerol kinase family lipid kinase [Acidobacteriota bacterium]
MTFPFLTIVNPAAGGGKSRKLVGAALDRLRAGGLALETVETHAEGDATRIARDAYGRGYRKFLAVGGDGTSYEVVNGLFPDALATSSAESHIPTLAFLPLGTGNSFLRDFGDQGVEHAMQALLARRSQACDVLRLTHREGVLYYINLLSVGFAADVNILRSRRFKNSGQMGYFASIFMGLAQLKRRPFPVRVAGEKEFDRRSCLFLSFNNSKFTGGTMMIAPTAATDDGLIDFVRWGPIGRAGLVRNLSTLYDGTHVQHPLAESKKTQRVEFDLDGPIDVMVDGEALTVHCEAIDVLPSVLQVVV